MTKKALCFGLEPYPLEGYVVDHCPLIEIQPFLFKEEWLLEGKKASHLLFTSKTAVDLLPILKCPVLAVGQATAQKAKTKGFDVVGVAENETQEGICDLLSKMNKISLFWPRSDKARSIIEAFCQEKGIWLFAPPIYTVLPKKITFPDLVLYDALYFTSPSTVDAFFSLEPTLPPSMQLIPIGEVTKKALSAKFCSQQTLSTSSVTNVIFI